MESKKNFSSDGDSDETLVTPRFDSGEAETARPVVPLAVVSGEAETYDVHAAGSASALRSARRTSWPLALVLVSALAGSVLGGVGLYLFQKSRQQSAAPIEQTNEASDAAGQTTAAPVAEATPAPSPEQGAALAAGLPEEIAEVPVADEVPEDRDDKKDADRKRDEPNRETDDDDAAPRAKPSTAAPVKHGKKGERDDDDDNYQARESRPRRVVDDSRDSSPDDDDDEEYYDRRQARRVGSIVYDREGRRERRRQRRQGGVDRVRGIFEGQP